MSTWNWLAESQIGNGQSQTNPACIKRVHNGKCGPWGSCLKLKQVFHTLGLCYFETFLKMGVIPVWEVTRSWPADPLGRSAVGVWTKTGTCREPRRCFRWIDEWLG